MNNSSNDTPVIRWDSLNQELHVMEDALHGLTLLGVLDRDTNPISDMQEEIDRKTREALVVYWLGPEHGELPRGVN